MKRFAPLVFAFVLVAALLGQAWLWFNTDGTLKHTQWQPPKPVPVQLGDAQTVVQVAPQLEPSQFVGVGERPLFSKTRRPPPPPPPPPPTVVVAPDIFSTAVLKGVFQADQQAGVIMQINGKSRRLKLNDNLEGWTLKSVQPGNATFESNGSQRVISLKRTPSVRAP